MFAMATPTASADSTVTAEALGNSSASRLAKAMAGATAEWGCADSTRSVWTAAMAVYSWTAPEPFGASPATCRP